jgi:hypothetical protein
MMTIIVTKMFKAMTHNTHSDNMNMNWRMKTNLLVHDWAWKGLTWAKRNKIEGRWSQE